MLEEMYAFYQQPMWMMVTFGLLVLWEMVWKGIALWYSGKNKQLPWFIVMFIFNTLGVLPIIYLIWFKPKQMGASEMKNVSVKAPVKKKKKK